MVCSHIVRVHAALPSVRAAFCHKRKSRVILSRASITCYLITCYLMSGDVRFSAHYLSPCGTLRNPKQQHRFLSVKNPHSPPKTSSVNTQRLRSCFGPKTQIKTLKLDGNCHQAPLRCSAPQVQFVILKDVSVDSKSICGRTVLGVQPTNIHFWCVISFQMLL